MVFMGILWISRTFLAEDCEYTSVKMPDSSAVYQPTTVGYSYDGGRDMNGGGMRGGIHRILSRHKLSTRKWIEWVIFSIAIAFFIIGFTTTIVNLVSADHKGAKENETPKVPVTIEEHSNDVPRTSIAVGAAMMILGLLMGFVWAWLRFFQRNKSPRGGMTSTSGQMLGGLNPSTDLLVGSTSQYGPVLTELPSQPKMKPTNTHEAPAITLSDQEEETHTLMEASAPTSAAGANTAVDQISA